MEKIPKAVPIYVDEKINNIESTITKKNTASIISEILQCSRQNVDMIMRRGNVNKIRELDFVAMHYLVEIYEEDR